MPSVLDTIDRLAYTATSLHSIALNSQREDIGPFTQAVLHSSLQSIIREADETEYNLFTFVNDGGDMPLEGQGRLGRKEFKTATPLKTRRTAGTNKDEEPEIYLEAALRYLDGFHTVKPLPGMRAHLQSLVERLNNARDQLEQVEESMQLIQKKGGNSSSHTQIREEEGRINELKVKISQLRKRKIALTHTTNPGKKQPPRSSTKVIATSSRLQLKEDSVVNMSIHSPLPASRPESRSSIVAPSAPQTSNLEDKALDPSVTLTKAVESRRMHVTPVMEKISAKIWNVIADILLPGNNFSQTGKVPDAKDTLTILETLSAQSMLETSTATSSPSAQSTLSSILDMEIHPPATGIPHQMLTASVLLTLMRSENHSISLTTLKTQLASRTEPDSTRPRTLAEVGASSVASRAIYGCVAKKLIRIDRGGGEQIVRFDQSIWAEA